MAAKTKEVYYEAIGRRKSACARVRLFSLKSKKDMQFLINQSSLEKYFPVEKFQKSAQDPLKRIKSSDYFRIVVNVKGGGLHAQAQAVGLGLARALEKFNANLRPELKKFSFLTRDPRRKERKKPGLRGARRAQQWSKR